MLSKDILFAYHIRLRKYKVSVSYNMNRGEVLPSNLIAHTRKKLPNSQGPHGIINRRIYIVPGSIMHGAENAAV